MHRLIKSMVLDEPESVGDFLCPSKTYTVFFSTAHLALNNNQELKMKKKNVIIINFLCSIKQKNIQETRVWNLRRYNKYTVSEKETFDA